MQKNKDLRKECGALYVVATPIGNLEDITHRAIRILKEVQLIAAEDTRRTKKLLHAYDITTPVTSLYDQNEASKSGYLISKVEEGMNLAYVSDAGTPGISDPGYILINEAITKGIRVVPIPGPSAVIAALSTSGLPMESFLFSGFLPSKSGKRKTALFSMKDETRTTIFYESPNRLLSTLKDIGEILGNREIVVARELTKVFEEIIRGPVGEIISRLTGRVIKGEITLVIAGRQKSLPPCSDEVIESRIRQLIKSAGLSPRDIAVRIAAELGVSRRNVYQKAVKLIARKTSREE